MLATEIWEMSLLRMISSRMHPKERATGVRRKRSPNAQRPRNWGLGQTIHVTFEVSKNNGKNSDRKTEG